MKQLALILVVVGGLSLAAAPVLAHDHNNRRHDGYQGDFGYYGGYSRTVARPTPWFIPPVVGPESYFPGGYCPNRYYPEEAYNYNYYYRGPRVLVDVEF
jgi:hypothetical protein